MQKIKTIVLGDLPYTASGLSYHAEMRAQGLERLGHEVVRMQPHNPKRADFIKQGFNTVIGIGAWFAIDSIVNPTKELCASPIPDLVSDGRVEGKQDIFNSLPLMFTPSQYCKSIYVADGVKPEIIHVLPIGIDLSMFKPNNSQVAMRLKRKLCGSVKKKMLLNVGATSLAKGGREIIEALPKVVKEYQDFKMVFKVQPSWAISKPEAQEIKRDKKRVHRLGLDPYVTWHEIQYPHMEDMVALFQACDIYVAPSRQDGFGISFVQSQACGKPVITQRGTAPEELILDGTTGLLCKTAKWGYYEWDGSNWLDYFVDKPKFHRPPYATIADSDDLSEKILKLLTDDDLRTKMGLNARIHMERNYEMTNIAKGMVDIIEQHWQVD